MRASAALLTLALLSVSESALAYCRTTTCGPGECDYDPACITCLVGGEYLYWPRGCVSFTVNHAGSVRRSIDPQTTQSIVTTAFQRWLGASCGTGTPNIQVYDFGFVTCEKQEYNQEEPNANIWMFRDGEWPYISGNVTLALTTLTFNVESGEIFDADVEINSFENELTTTDTGVQADLESIIVHEAGHFLGLSHTCDQTATMYRDYTFGDTSLRTLEADDIAGICAIYPPGEPLECNPTPRHGFSRQCASGVEKGCCTTAPGGPRQHGPWAIGIALLGAGLLAARRYRRNS